MTAEILATRLDDGRDCVRLVDADDDLSVDARLALGDAAAVYDAIVEAVAELQAIADQYGDLIGDPESLERVRRLRERKQRA